MAPQNIALLTDSCADLSPRLAAENHIYMVPLRILCADGEYSDGVDIHSADIYRRLKAGELPQTSLPSAESAGAVLEEIRDAGYDGVIAVMLSSGLSGTYNLLRLISEESGDTFPIKVFDSVSGSLGQGLTVLQLAEDIRTGMDWETLLERRAPQLIASTFPFFSVDPLEYLMKKTQEFLAIVLAMIPPAAMIFAWSQSITSEVQMVNGDVIGMNINMNMPLLQGLAVVAVLLFVASAFLMPGRIAKTDQG